MASNSGALINQLNQDLAAIKSLQDQIADIVNPILKSHPLSGPILAYFQGYSQEDPLKPPLSLSLQTFYHFLTAQENGQIINLQSQMKPLQTQAQAIWNELNPGSLLPLYVILAIASLGTAAALAGYGAAGAAAASEGVSATAVAAPVIAPISTGAIAAAGAGAVTTPIVVAAGTAGGAAAATASAGITATTAASSVGSAVTSLTGSSTAGAVASSVVSGVGDLISDFKSIFGPIASFAQTVLTDVENIDKEYIVPFTTAISKDYTTISGLINEVHTLSQSGIQGILAIPSAISSALTSIDAANLRLAQATGAINQGIATDTLVPGIGGAIANPLGNIQTTLQKTLDSPVPNIGELNTEPLDESEFAGFDPSQSQAQAVSQLSAVPVFGPVLVAVLGVWKDILQFIGYLESWVSFSAQAGRLAQPIEPIGIGEAIKAWWRGQLSQDDAVTEIKRHGVEPTRAQLLHDLEEWLPGPADALRMYYRGVITSDEVSAALTKQGFDADDIAALTQAAIDPVTPAEALELQGRTTALTQGFLSNDLGSTVPDEFQQIYKAAQASPDQAQLDWLGHFNIQEMSWWATAVFRGIASQDEFNLAATAHNIPASIIPSLLSIEQETIQLWMIPDMIASNLFTADEAASYLAYIGIAPRDAQLIIQYGQSKANASASTDALGLGTVALGTASKMYADGIINDSEYTDILEAHKLTPEATALIIQLEDQNNALETRRGEAKTLVKQVAVGVITLQQMQQQLYQLGFTQTEVDNYTAQANAATLDNAKFPSEAQIKAFFVAGILSQTDAVAALQTLGYSPYWANAFMTLWSAKDATTANTSTA